MSAPRARHDAWFLQAEDDLRWGRDSLAARHFAQACFIAQHVGEKALKALAFQRGFDVVKSHSIARIAGELDIDGEILQVATTLDLYYISARYPDALPDGVAPFEHFTERMAAEALRFAERIVERVRSERGPR